MNLKATNKDEFDTALLSALNALGNIDYPIDWESGWESVPERFHGVLKGTKTENVEGEELTTPIKVVLDFFPSSPKARDEEGEYIVESTDEEGNPTYQLAEGYHVELASSVKLDLEALVVTPEQPQFKFL